ncbi:hypothetical protein C0W92_11305 [Photobacterium angustum]|uniref:winged helix-turn-helix domain-containing protein n=1 Tax=Photobacterium angustum TaxID=661 RepID=UPI0005DD62B5|nr:winged helix-turn-helix domain-containing protein [Photobacterium angustum]KJG33233.1 hypothetical protein UA69_04400 [Photobacterium angustum]PSW89550.1 hypothetical protein C0W92_11305 [Photobacterium angustum]
MSANITFLKNERAIIIISEKYNKKIDLSKLSTAELNIMGHFTHNINQEITRKELINIGWPYKSVSMSSLNVAVANIRKIFLAYDIDSNLSINTVPTIGYIFNASFKDNQESIHDPTSEDIIENNSTIKTTSKLSFTILSMLTMINILCSFMVSKYIYKLFY